MRYGNIKGIEKPVAKLVLGTICCNEDDMENSGTILNNYLAAGGNCFDTARIYNEGKAEKALGKWFTESGKRDEIVLLGKGGHPDHNGDRISPEKINEDIANSLRALQTDHFDIFLLHRDNRSVSVQVLVDLLNEHKDAGRMKAFGGSNWTTARLQEANDYAEANGLQGFSASSEHLSLAVWNEPIWGGCLRVDENAEKWHREHQFPLFPWSAQARGFFTGRYSPEDLSNEEVVRSYYNKDNWEKYRRATEIGEKRGATANQIALAFVIGQEYPVFAVAGPMTPAELATTLPAADIVLTQGEKDYLTLKS
ncbi:MAG: aldo/keto reductase [Chthonomonadaceae bacterium]|nr:aldo/keto reductase [Chthonomonadaceae bacterium]